MDTIIGDLVNRFERGALTRRQLVHRLTALVVAGGASTSAAAQTGELKSTAIDHTSVLVGDLQQSAEFYRRIFGLVPVSEDKANRILRLGTGGTGVNSTLVSLRQQNPRGLIDHFAISVENFNRETVTQRLKTHGITPEQNIEFGFHIKDPDGAVVQIV